MSNKLHPAIIDIEASGIGSESYPIEVGIVLSSGARYCTLIKPHESWTYWSKSAERLHHIPQPILFSRGKDMVMVCEQLNEFIGGKTIFSDNVSADKPWLKKLFLTTGIKPNFQLYGIERINVGNQEKYWDEARLEVNKKFKLTRHRASNEAFLIQQTFIESRRLSELYTEEGAMLSTAGLEQQEAPLRSRAN